MAYSKNSTLLNLFIWLNELDLFYMTLRIEPFSARLKELNSFQYHSKKWTFSLIKYDPKVWNFSDMTQRTEHFFECDSKNWTLFTKGLQELIFWFFRIFLQIWTLFKHDSQNWTLFEQYDSLRLNPFQHESKKMTLLKNDSKIFFLFAKCMTQRMNWIIRSWKNMTLRIEIFERKTDSKNWTFSKIDSMDWTFCFTWPKELNLFFLYNSKDWTFS